MTGRCTFPYCLEDGGDQCLQLDGCNAIPDFETRNPEDIRDTVSRRTIRERVCPAEILGDIEPEEV